VVASARFRTPGQRGRVWADSRIVEEHAMVKATNRYVRASALHGNPIITGGGDAEYEVQDVIVDEDGREVLGFSAREPGVFGKRHVGVVPLSGVSSIGPDAVMVKADAVEDPPDEEDRLGTQLLGSSVVTEAGVEVGRISDLVLETSHNKTRVTAVEVDPVTGTGRYLALRDDETMPADALVVHAGAEAELAESPEDLVAQVEGDDS
jgi:uncharacterized protein YrrD